MDLDSDIQSSSKIETTIPRQLVLDYLLHNCYGETARAFMKDDLDAARDSEAHASRRSHSISNGTHGHAHTHGNGASHNHSNQSHTSRGGVMTRSASSADDLGNTRHINGSNKGRPDDTVSLMDTDKSEELDQEGDSPMADGFQDSATNGRTSQSTSVFSTDKTHAAHIDEQLKNLETRKAIRSLISHGDIAHAMEVCNAAFPGVLSIDPNSPLTSPASIHMNFKLQCQRFIEIVKSDPERGPDALMFAQDVLHKFQHLDPPSADQYIKHMEEIVSVIAYSNPEDSPNGHHLKQEARDNLADIMNSAVLGCNGMSCEPALLTIVKQATVVREYLAADPLKSKRGIKPKIPVRIPNDDSTFNPKEYPNVVFKSAGKISGKIRLVHGEDGDNGLGLISTRIWVTRESDKDDLSITINRDNQTHSVLFQAPDTWTSLNVNYETTIQIPSSTRRMQSLVVEGPNTSFSGEHLQNLAWGSIRTAFSNGSIQLTGVDVETLGLKTSNGSISGTYEGGHLDIQTTNGPITAKLRVRNAADGRQSVISVGSNNASVDLHVDGSATSRGLHLDTITTNGRLSVGALIVKASQASYINASTNNGSIGYNVDARQSGQPLQYTNRTANGSVVASVMVPVEQPFKGSVSSSNGSVTVNLTEDFHGRFDLDTSNSRSTVEGTDIQFDEEKKATKRGTRGGDGPSEIKIHSSNASTNLFFHPPGESLAAEFGASGKE
ncbi:Ran-binding protein 9 [Podila clonocystis]|nr:Ran-binding protein 9 [Podila clonocystis]